MPQAAAVVEAVTDVVASVTAGAVGAAGDATTGAVISMAMARSAGIVSADAVAACMSSARSFHAEAAVQA